MIEVLLVLALPVAGAALLAIVGHRRHAPAVNVAVSVATFAAAAVPAVLGAGSTSAPRRMLSLRAVSKSRPSTAAYFAACEAYLTPFSVPMVPK